MYHKQTLRSELVANLNLQDIPATSEGFEH